MGITERQDLLVTTKYREVNRGMSLVPLSLAAAHQAGAVLLFAAALNVAHALR